MKLAREIAFSVLEHSGAAYASSIGSTARERVLDAAEEAVERRIKPVTNDLTTTRTALESMTKERDAALRSKAIAEDAYLLLKTQCQTTK